MNGMVAVSRVSRYTRDPLGIQRDRVMSCILT